MNVSVSKFPMVACLLSAAIRLRGHLKGACIVVLQYLVWGLYNLSLRANTEHLAGWLDVLFLIQFFPLQLHLASN